MKSQNTEPIKYRKHEWYDIVRDRPMYGIQALIPGRLLGQMPRWLHCQSNGTPLIYTNSSERDAKLKELRTTSRKPDRLTMKTPIYRNLEPGEHIQEGDEYSIDGKTWHKSTGQGVYDPRRLWPMRRKVAAQPSDQP